MKPDTTSPSSSFQLILDTAEQLIREKGCNKTTLQDIIDRSGLSKGAIYHYVSGKDELFGRVLISKMEQMNTQFNQTVSNATKSDATSPVQMLTQGMMKNTDSHSVTNKIFTYLISQSENPKVALILTELYDFSLNLSIQWIQIGQKAGAIPAHIDAVKLSTIFNIFTFGLRTHRVINPNDDQISVEDIFNVIFKSLQ
ncbi:MAG: TetR/AcrR family transcriptional regulator [Candidatus Cohnella colombiensis]|uniref:TetR/AcrR family transcriptional regulator n=1 Tax=Candidatus Cohnella colombiensis TaxID=3121368 RepID=A0AA95EWK3_9BACL|nr:MAG: TetR/AcrR family transcriptional regulator [Cohnella sp.]